jgi:predicted acetyltransferase
MAIEIRPARQEEMREFAYLGSITFGESTDDARLDRSVALGARDPDQTLCAFDDGVMAARMATMPFTMHWNGRTIGCGGVTSVGTLPNYRRRGYLRTMMTQSFATMRAANQPIATLWASMAAIYQRFGYGISGLLYSAELDPRQLRFIDEIATPGRIRIVRGEEILPALSPAYNRFAPSRTMALVRSAEHWQNRQLRHWDESQPPNLHAVYEEAGEPLGYVTYAVERERRRGPDQRLRVDEFIASTPSAHRALVQYLLAYDLAFTIELNNLPVDDPLFHHVQEPRELKVTLRDGVLLRLVDVPVALEGRGYDEDGTLTFALNEEMCPWNTGAWTLTVEGGQGRVQQANCAPDLQISQRALALLACGTLDATQLCAMGLLPPAETRALRTADRLFRTATAPFCPDHF